MPRVFVELCGWFHQDVLSIYPTFSEAVSAFVRQLDDSSKVALNAYLSELISSDATDQQLQELWGRCGADWWFTKESIRDFFRGVQRAIASGR